jgi:hypothetical protein
MTMFRGITGSGRSGKMRSSSPLDLSLEPAWMKRSGIRVAFRIHSPDFTAFYPGYQMLKRRQQEYLGDRS